MLDWDCVTILSALDVSAMGIHYLKLFNKTPFKLLTRQVCLIDRSGFAHGMQAYMLTRAGAERFLAVCNPVRRPVDDEMEMGLNSRSEFSSEINVKIGRRFTTEHYDRIIILTMW